MHFTGCLLSFALLQVTLILNNVFQLPFSSTFPMASPNIEIYFMLVG